MRSPWRSGQQDLPASLLITTRDSKLLEVLPDALGFPAERVVLPGFSVRMRTNFVSIAVEKEGEVKSAEQLEEELPSFLKTFAEKSELITQQGLFCNDAVLQRNGRVSSIVLRSAKAQYLDAGHQKTLFNYVFTIEGDLEEPGFFNLMVGMEHWLLPVGWPEPAARPLVHYERTAHAYVESGTYERPPVEGEGIVLEGIHNFDSRAISQENLYKSTSLLFPLRGSTLYQRMGQQVGLLKSEFEKFVRD